MVAVCEYCKEDFEMLTGHYNRAKKLGNSVYCSSIHAGLLVTIRMRY